MLYTKGPESFMALMTDFRETLSQVCQCIVSYFSLKVILNLYYIILYYIKSYIILNRD